MVKKAVLEDPRCIIWEQYGVYFIITEMVGILPEEDVVLIPLPASVIHLLTEEEAAPKDPVSPVARAFKLPADLILEFFRHYFIRVDNQDPGMRGPADGPASLIRRRNILVLVEDIGIWFRPFHGLVGTEGVDHDQFINPADTLKAPLNLIFYVEAGNDTTYFIH